MSEFQKPWLEDADRSSKAEALQRAWEDNRAKPQPYHPRFWAGFQLVGTR